MIGKKYSTTWQIFYFALIVVVVLIIAYGVISWTVYSELESICAEVTTKYPLNQVDALVIHLNDGTLNKKGIYRFIWALGELRDKRALIHLKELLKIPSIDNYEVKKAIEKIEGKIPNLYFWRKFLKK